MPDFAFHTKDVIKKTFQATTQFAHVPASPLLTKHLKSPTPALNVPHCNEDVAADTMCSDVPAIDDGSTQAQLCCGMSSLVIDVHGTKTNKEFINTFEDLFCTRGAMKCLLSDSAMVETMGRAADLMCMRVIGNWQSESHQQQQNPAEHHWQTIKHHTNTVMECSGSPAFTWLLALACVCFIFNHAAMAALDWHTPIEQLAGTGPDISPLLCFHWWQHVCCKLDDANFPLESCKKSSHFVGIAESVGCRMTWTG